MKPPFLQIGANTVAWLRDKLKLAASETEWCRTARCQGSDELYKQIFERRIVRGLGQYDQKHDVAVQSSLMGGSPGPTSCNLSTRTPSAFTEATSPTQPRALPIPERVCI